MLRFGLLKCKKRSSGFMSASSTIEVQFGYPDFKKHNRTKILAPTKQNLQSSQKCIIGPFILYLVILSQIETFSPLGRGKEFVLHKALGQEEPTGRKRLGF